MRRVPAAMAASTPVSRPRRRTHRGVRRPHRAQWRRQPAAHHDLRRLSRRHRALHHGVRVRRAAVARSGPSHPCPASRAASRRAATGPSSGSSARPIRLRPGVFASERVQRAASAEVLMEVTHRRARHHGAQGRRRRGRAWAAEHGFRLPPDAPEVLDFYAQRSPIFLAASFDADAAAERGQAIGDGTPVHITIPTANPWVPLRILSLGKCAEERVEADVYLLTDRVPDHPARGDSGGGLEPRPHGARERVAARTTSAPTGAWSGCRSGRG